MVALHPLILHENLRYRHPADWCSRRVPSVSLRRPASSRESTHRPPTSLGAPRPAFFLCGRSCVASRLRCEVTQLVLIVTKLVCSALRGSGGCVNIDDSGDREAAVYAVAQSSNANTKSARRYDGWRSSDYTERKMIAWGRRSALLSIT